MIARTLDSAGPSFIVAPLFRPAQVRFIGVWLSYVSHVFLGIAAAFGNNSSEVRDPPMYVLRGDRLRVRQDHSTVTYVAGNSRTILAQSSRVCFVAGLRRWCGGFPNGWSRDGRRDPVASSSCRYIGQDRRACGTKQTPGEPEQRVDGPDSSIAQDAGCAGTGTAHNRQRSPKCPDAARRSSSNYPGRTDRGVCS